MCLCNYVWMYLYLLLTQISIDCLAVAAHSLLRILDFWRNIWEFKQNKFCESQSHHMRRQLASFKCEAYLQFKRRLIRGGNWRRRFRHKRRQLRSFLTSSCWGSRSTTAGWTESGRDRGAGWGEVERHGRDLTWDFLLCVKASFRKFWHVQLSNCKWKFLHSIHRNM